jgi:hypothetical protein
MAAFARVIKVVVTLASFLASLETITRLAKIAWALFLELVRRQPLAGKTMRVPNFRFGWKS